MATHSPMLSILKKNVEEIKLISGKILWALLHNIGQQVEGTAKQLSCFWF
jgi:hypothetical protein